MANDRANILEAIGDEDVHGPNPPEVGYFERFRLQIKPWKVYLWENLFICTIFSLVPIAIASSIYLCVILFFKNVHPENPELRYMAVIGIVMFSVNAFVMYCAFLRQHPPFLASRYGVPIYGVSPGFWQLFRNPPELPARNGPVRGVRNIELQPIQIAEGLEEDDVEPEDMGDVQREDLGDVEPEGLDDQPDLSDIEPEDLDDQPDDLNDFEPEGLGDAQPGGSGGNVQAGSSSGVQLEESAKDASSLLNVKESSEHQLVSSKTYVKAEVHRSQAEIGSPLAGDSQDPSEDPESKSSEKDPLLSSDSVST